MSEQGDPPRWRHGHDAPPQLQRALRALQAHDFDAARSARLDGARIARVEGRLGELLDAAPGSNALTRFMTRHGVRKLVVARIAAGMLAIGGSAMLWQVTRRAPPAPVAQHAVATEAAERVRAPIVVAQPPTVVEREPEPSVEPAVPSLDVRATAPTRSARKLHRARASHAAPVAVPPSSTDSASELHTAEPAPVEPAAVAQVAPPTPVEDAGAPVQPAREPSEIELLFTARQQMAKHPRAALRALDQHAARFPSGLLAPEREVLAIEALRKLGETDEADERLRAFRAQYPDSLHLRRLERSE